MRGARPVGADEGGEAPRFAHILGDTEPASEALLAQLVTTMADAVVIADEAGTITYARRPRGVVATSARRR
jgi:hypothetical protein